MESVHFGEVWRQANQPGAIWPLGYKILRGKLFHLDRLCVPERWVWGLCREFHEWNGHLTPERLAPGMDLRFEPPAGVQFSPILQRVRENCLVCQQCQAPTWSLKQKLEMTPIPPRVMASVCLDVFSMPEVEWQGQTYDAFLLCVDRHSGWTIARPTTHTGLTGEKAAHLLLDSGWGEMGIPAVVTSDQGPQFTSQWWRTMCARLGIRGVYSQAHRPQANGRAEVGGRVLQDLLRKMAQKEDLNWVEALPRALRIHHDTVDPVMGITPYQAVFGRERALGGLPWPEERECREAQEFFDHQQEMDRYIAEKINRHHEKLAAKLNAKRLKRPPYEVGAWVWLRRPKMVGGVKLQIWWKGPYQVLRRVGDCSYVLRLPLNETLEVHADQLKACIWEALDSQGVPMAAPPAPEEPVPADP